MVETKEVRGEFVFQRIGGNYVLIYPEPTQHTNSTIPMTGSEVKKTIDIPFVHRIVKLIVVHYTSAYVKTQDPMTVQLQLEKGVSNISTVFSDILLHCADVANADMIERFGEGFEYEARQWSLSLTADSTDRVMPLLYIQNLGGSSH